MVSPNFLAVAGGWWPVSYALGDPLVSDALGSTFVIQWSGGRSPVVVNARYRGLYTRGSGYAY